MTKPGWIRKLLGMLALTYSWTRIIGIDREAREGPLGNVGIRKRAGSG